MATAAGIPSVMAASAHKPGSQTMTAATEALVSARRIRAVASDDVITSILPEQAERSERGLHLVPTSRGGAGGAMVPERRGR